MITWSYVGRPSSSPPLVGYAEVERDVVTNDWKLPIRIIRGPDAVTQRLRQKFPFILGEWFLDTRLGMPWRETILVKNPDRGLITSLVRRTIVDTPGFGRVLTIALTLDKATREGTINFEALLEDPSIIVRGVDAPFKMR